MSYTGTAYVGTGHEESNEYLVATLRVVKIRRTVLRGTSAQPPKRETCEVTHLTIRAKDIETLRRKVSGHMDLIDDDVTADPEENTATRG